MFSLKCSRYDPWSTPQNVRRPDRRGDVLWAAGQFVLREDDQYQWAVCVFEWKTPLTLGVDKFDYVAALKSIRAWCPNASHAVKWANCNCSLHSEQFVLVRRAPFWTLVRNVEWRSYGVG